jgi:spore germination cell wall hydrolase CwlJ-like protein
MQTKYIRGFTFVLATMFVVAVVGAVTVDKIHGLRQQQSAQTPTFVTVKERERQLHCMTQNVYYEAAHEPAEGKIAVAQVVMNRVASPDFPNDPCQVIFQKNHFYSRVVCQFSWYCDGSQYRRPIREDLWRESQDAAKLVLLENFRLTGLENALFYHADYVNPRWPKDRITQIGRHIFYQPRSKRDA